MDSHLYSLAIRVGVAMRTLSIKQPWADLILSGTKDVENRTWSTGYRGPILIHAGKRVDRAGAEMFPEETSLALQGGRMGAIVGSAYLYGCTQKQRSEWHENGCWGWYLADPVALPQPIPWPGQLSLFDIDLRKVIPPMSVCSRCRANLLMIGKALCRCCQWCVDQSSHRFMVEASRERRLYIDHLSRKYRTGFEARKV